ncbi:bifunctional 3-(3-hydroxy-phenyl)propionate/3-hydroxycinnamic acid hydroxylase [Tenacibaculum sp. C7A-26P2]|uniref:bifunctional 3-(3-hydroxy-phenyl)propionate/3-hydroxycinnamic acid hydroxylase n=1 Tax=Tenacibaculum sp. C7A-26P2 TaxID=3447504 RepID=UPI003F83B4DF
MNFDIVIAGCGPTGATFANYFGNFGLKVLVFDKEKDIIDYPRAVHIDEDVIRVFQELGLYEEMKKDAIKPFQNYVLADEQGKTLFKFSPNSSISHEIPSCNWILQPEIEKYLRKGFAKYKNVSFFENTELIDVSQTADSVKILIRKNSEEKICITSKFLIGCDGGKSFIRKKIGVSNHDFGFKKSWMVLDTEYHGNEKFSEDHKQFCNPKQPVTYVNGVGNHFRWEFMINPKHNVSDESKVFQNVLPYLNKDYPLEDFKIIRKKIYTFHTLVANRWRVKNIFLAGDAAHQMPPFLGQGMCSGIKDAKNLSWKLALACQNRSQETNELLDSYYNERVPQVNMIIKIAAIMGGVIQYGNPILYHLRNILLKIINVLPSSPIDRLIEKYLYSLAKTKSFNHKYLTGRRFPQPLVHTNNKTCFFDCLIAKSWVVVYRNIEIPENFSVFLKKIEIVRSRPFSDQIVSEDLEIWMDKNKIDFVILRPDKFIFHAGKKGQEFQILPHTVEYLTRLYQN